VIGKGRSNGLHTTVECRSGFLQVRRPGHVTASEELTAQQDVYSRFPANAVSSVTVDNGSEFAHHHHLADAMCVRPYFCDPHILLGSGELMDTSTGTCTAAS
jgi:IS30 family transposase